MCLTGPWTISIHPKRLQISDAHRKQTGHFELAVLVVGTFQYTV